MDGKDRKDRKSPRHAPEAAARNGQQLTAGPPQGLVCSGCSGWLSSAGEFHAAIMTTAPTAGSKERSTAWTERRGSEPAVAECLRWVPTLGQVQAEAADIQQRQLPVRDVHAHQVQQQVHDDCIAWLTWRRGRGPARAAAFLHSLARYARRSTRLTSIRPTPCSVGSGLTGCASAADI